MRRLAAFATVLLVLPACRIAPGRAEPGPRGVAALSALLAPRPLQWSAGRPAPATQRAAVVIAAARYEHHPEWDLPAAEASADAVADALVAYCGVPAAAVVRVGAEDAHRDAVAAAIARAAALLQGPGGTLFLYYAGHGWVDPDGDPLLLGRFTRAQEGGGFAPGIARRDLVRAVAEARRTCAVRGVDVEAVLVVDACRVGVAAPPPKAKLTEAPLWELWATKPGAYAQVGGDGFAFSSAFTEAVAALGETAQEVDLRRLFEEVRARVVRRTLGRQEPELLAPRLGAVPPAAVVSAAVPFRVTLVDAVTSVRVPGFTVRLGNRTFHAGPSGEAGVEVRPGTHRLEVAGAGYLPRVEDVELRAEHAGCDLEVPVWPAMVLVDGRISPPGVVSVRATGALGEVRDNYHLLRTISGRDGAFQLRLPVSGPGCVLEFVVDGRVVHTVPVPEAGDEVVVGGAHAVPKVALAVDLPAAADVYAVDRRADPAEPERLPHPGPGASPLELQRIEALVLACRYDMARDALDAFEVAASDEALRQQWLHWLDVRAAQVMPVAAVFERLGELAARGAPMRVREDVVATLLQRLVDERDFAGVFDLFALCAEQRVAGGPEFEAQRRRWLPVALVHVLRGALADGTQRGDWRRADEVSAWMLAAENLWVLRERPELEELRAEVQRERVPPQCRQAVERADIAIAEGRLAEARALLQAAATDANAYYRERIADRLRHIDSRTFEDAMREGTRHEVAGRSAEALHAYARAYACDPRAAESLRRVLRTTEGRDAAFQRAYDALLDTMLRRAHGAEHPSAWAELSQWFGADPRARAALAEALVLPWAEIVDPTCGPSGLPRAVRDRRTGIVLRLVEAGRFWMGASADDRLATAVERPRHRVAISAPFWLGETEVTWDAWRLFVAEVGVGGQIQAASERHPVGGVTWLEAERFCAHFGFRLPTEAEWEFAARAGEGAAYRRYPWGDDPRQATGNLLGADAAGDAEAFPVHDGFPGVAPAGAFAPSALGFHDLVGNLRELCADAFTRDAYRVRGELTTDPFHEDRTAPTVVVRGASYQDGPRTAGVATRFEQARDARLPWVGFRVARSVF